MPLHILGMGEKDFYVPGVRIRLPFTEASQVGGTQLLGFELRSLGLRKNFNGQCGDLFQEGHGHRAKAVGCPCRRTQRGRMRQVPSNITAVVQTEAGIP